MRLGIVMYVQPALWSLSAHEKEQALLKYRSNANGNHYYLQQQNCTT